MFLNRMHYLVAIARKIVGPDECEDVCSEAVLNVLKNRAAIRPDQLECYMRAAIVRTGINYLRKRDARERRNDRLVVSADSDTRQCGGNHEEAVRVGRVWLESRLQQMLPDWRRMFVLRTVYGLSYEELAEEMQIPVGTVKSRLQRIRLALIADWRRAEQMA